MFRDFLQKERNKPRKITDVAIAKVRKIIFDGFDDEQNLYLQAQHKRLLSISKDHNSSQEVGVLIDIINWEDWIVFGKGNKILMKDNKIKNINKSNASLWNIKKPSKPHVMDSQVELTEQELKKRKFVEEQLSKLGISISVFDAEKDGYEDPDVLEAIIIVNRGEEVPEDLKVRLQKKLTPDSKQQE